jgi:hypothetical protein
LGVEVNLRVEIFYIEGCPNFQPTVRVVEEALNQRGLSVPVVMTRVGDGDEAARIGFLGSPSVRINGLDIDPSARNSTRFGLTCRRYEDGGGVPSPELILRAIEEESAAPGA